MKKRDEIIVKHLPLVHSIVYKLASQAPAIYDVEDLISIGIVGLINAVDNYSTSHGTLLRTYARRKIVGAILDYFRKEDHLSRSARLKHKQIEQGRNILEHELGRKAYDLEVSDKVEVPLDDYNTVMWQSGLSIKPSEDEGGVETVVSCFTEQPDNILITSQLVDRLSWCILQLPERECVVFALYYYEALNFREIGEIFDLGESRISQIMHKAMTTIVATLKGEPRE
jgi:RNA polymerase sigma factor for flagellar operon FliA